MRKCREGAKEPRIKYLMSGKHLTLALHKRYEDFREGTRP